MSSNTSVSEKNNCEIIISLTLDYFHNSVCGFVLLFCAIKPIGRPNGGIEWWFQASINSSKQTFGTRTETRNTVNLVRSCDVSIPPSVQNCTKASLIGKLTQLFTLTHFTLTQLHSIRLLSVDLVLSKGSIVRFQLWSLRYF